MRMDDIMAVLAGSGPMSTVDILRALDLEVTAGHRAEVHNRMRRLSELGRVRRTGYGLHNATIWEAVE